MSATVRGDKRGAFHVDLAVFIPTLGGGGAERVMVTLANAFAAEGRAVDLVVCKAEGPCLRQVDKEVNIVALGSPRVLSCIPRLVAYMRNRKPWTVLSALTHANLIAILVRPLIIGHRPRLFVSERDTLSYSLRTASRTKRHVFRFLVRHTYHRADGIVAVSRGVADDLQSYLPGGEQYHSRYL